MAKLTLSKDMDTFMAKLYALEKGTTPIAKMAVYDGAGIVADAIRSELRGQLQGSKYATGDLEGSIGIAPMEESIYGGANTRIGFDGYDRKGVPNALKARARESGTSTQPKRPFVRPALKKCEKQAVKKMDDRVNEQAEKTMKE